MRILLAAWLMVVISACTTQNVKTTEIETIKQPAIVEPDKLSDVYYVNVPDVDKLVFHGQLNTDGNLSQPGSMVYPGYDAASFLVAIATHAVIADSINNKKKAEATEAADAVLSAYQPVIDTILPQSVLDESIELFAQKENSLYTIDNSANLPRHNSWYIDIEPVYIMSGNEKSIAIEARVRITESRYLGNPEDSDKVYSKILYLQSAPIEKRSLWLASEGEQFKKTVTSLFVKSLQLALEDFNESLPRTTESMRTIRYFDNNRKKVERGRPIRQSCTHILFESLRGRLKSVPLPPNLIEKNCKAEKTKA